MRVLLGLAFLLGGFVLASAQETYFGNDKVNIAKEKFLKEFNEIQLGIDQPTASIAGILKKHRYCVKCSDGRRLNCDVPVWGEVGKSMCGSYGLEACGGGQVEGEDWYTLPPRFIRQNLTLSIPYSVDAPPQKAGYRETRLLLTTQAGRQA
jgi:hypothetical protein